MCMVHPFAAAPTSISLLNDSVELAAIYNTKGFIGFDVNHTPVAIGKVTIQNQLINEQLVLISNARLIPASRILGIT